jgi:hypothetical protein
MVTNLCMNIYCVILSGVDSVPRLLRDCKDVGEDNAHKYNLMTQEREHGGHYVISCFKASVIERTGELKACTCSGRFKFKKISSYM